MPAEWICVDCQLPAEFGVYDVTIEDCFHGNTLLNLGTYRPKDQQWELLVDKHNYQDCRVIAWRDRGKPFDWKDL